MSKVDEDTLGCSSELHGTRQGGEQQHLLVSKKETSGSASENAMKDWTSASEARWSSGEKLMAICLLL